MANEARTRSSKQASLRAAPHTNDVRPIHPLPLSARAIREKFEGLEPSLKSRLVRNDETQEEFDRLFDHLLEATNPRNAIEFIYIRKAADITAQINRYERDRDGLLVTEQMRLLKFYLKDVKIKPDIETALLQWSAGEETAVTVIESVLERHGMTTHAVYSKVLENKVDALQKIEGIINGLENRRFASFREIDRHREALGKQLQDAIRLQDGSYSIVFAQGEEPLTKGVSATSHGSK
ncbi:hypothetical protein KIH24_14890 [Rhizobiales bacterium TNE-4]|nr:hypothetical protein [Rhizobiales bacterium TNE-4]MBV1828908.1 hypothetical protein [Rhizobiales bacterium TNE-4]